MSLSRPIRSSYPVLRHAQGGRPLVYLDAACTALKPVNVLSAVTEYYEKYSLCAGDRSLGRIARQLDEKCENVRKKVKKFLGLSDSGTLIWTKNTTEALNLVSYSFNPPSSKNKIIMSQLEHSSLLLPFMRMAKKKDLSIEWIDRTEKGVLDIEMISRLVDEKSAMVVVSGCSNVYGFKEELSRISKIAHSKGCLLCVDGAQYVPHFSINMEELGIDYLACSYHKIGGPPGIGSLGVSNEGMKYLDHFLLGGGTVSEISLNNKNEIKVEYLKEHKVFEAGTPNYAGIMGVGGLIEFVEKLGMNNIKKHCDGLLNQLLSNIEKYSEIEIIGSNEIENRALLAFTFKGKLADSENDFALFSNEMFKNAEIYFRVGKHCSQILHNAINVSTSARVSPYIYNDENDIELFNQALEAFIQYKYSRT